jgi:hypothetical protein
MSKTPLYVLALGCLAAPVAAGAATPGTSDTGTMHITVVIPPLGAAVATAAAGADGLWTVQPGRDGLMIQAPTQIVDREQAQVVLSSSHAGALRVLSFDGGVIKASGKSTVNQFERRVFTLSPAAGTASSHTALFTIGTV